MTAVNNLWFMDCYGVLLFSSLWPTDFPQIAYTVNKVVRRGTDTGDVPDAGAHSIWSVRHRLVVLGAFLLRGTQTWWKYSKNFKYSAEIANRFLPNRSSLMGYPGTVMRLRKDVTASCQFLHYRSLYYFPNSKTVW